MLQILMRTRSSHVSSPLQTTTSEKLSKKSDDKSNVTSALKDSTNTRQFRSNMSKNRETIISNTAKKEKLCHKTAAEKNNGNENSAAVDQKVGYCKKFDGNAQKQRHSKTKRTSSSTKNVIVEQENQGNLSGKNSSESSDDEVLIKKVKNKVSVCKRKKSGAVTTKSEAAVEKQKTAAPRKRQSIEVASTTIMKSKNSIRFDDSSESSFGDIGSDSDWFDESKDVKPVKTEQRVKPSNIANSSSSARAPRKSKVKAKDDIKQSASLKDPVDDENDGRIPVKAGTSYNDLDWESENDPPPKKKKLVKKKTTCGQPQPKQETSKAKVQKLATSKTNKAQKKTAQNLSDSDSDDWEEVPGVDRFKQSLGLATGVNGEDHQGVTVVLEKDKDEAFKNFVAQMIRKAIRRKQASVHKAFLVCFCAAGRYRSSICNSELLQAMILSLIPATHVNKPGKSWNVESIKVFETWFSSTFKISENIFGRRKVNVETLERCIQKRKCEFYSEYVMLFVTALRSLGFFCRFAWAAQPPVIKAKVELTDCEKKLTKKVLRQREIDEEILKKAEVEKSELCEKPEIVKEVQSESVNKDESISSDDEMMDMGPMGNNLDDIRALLMQTEQIEDTNLRPQSTTNNEVTSSYFKPSSVIEKEEVAEKSKYKCGKNKNSGKQSKTKNKIEEKKEDSKSETETDLSQDAGTNCWVEVYLKKEDCWIPFSPVDKIFNKPYVIEKQVLKALSYVFVFDNYNCFKDVTKRYASKWGSVNQKLRVDWIDKEKGKKWLKSFCGMFKPLDATFDTKEDIQIADQMCNMPIPGTVSELKDHPLYVLERHLLKFEVLHPKTAPILGYVKNEPVFSRKNVKLCHTEQTWLKEGMSVKQNEYPVKYVKPLISHAKLKKMEGKEIPMSGLYGDWQVELFKSPPVVDGRIPRNEYDNVNLFKMHMLPPGAVYLDLPGLDKIAKSLDVDCVSAMRGWDFSGFRARPVLEGFVVCAENEQLLRDCWAEKRREAEEKSREFRAMTNWTRLIKAFKIRQIIKRKYEYSEKEACGEKTLAKDDDDFEVI